MKAGGSILAEADDLTAGARNKAYGPWSEDAGNTMKIMAILKPGHEVGLNLDADREWFTFAMIVLKLVRESFNAKRDNRVDMAGYTKLLDQLHTGEAEDR